MCLILTFIFEICKLSITIDLKKNSMECGTGFGGVDATF